MLADERDYVVGVDTHRDQHVLAVVAAPSGAVIAQRSIGAEAGGDAEALRFAHRHAPGARVWAIEGAGHDGSGLARFLAQHEERLHEVSRTSRGERRLRGKDDPLDAIRAGPDGAHERDDRDPALRLAPGGAAGAAAGPAQRRRRPPRRARPASQPDRDRS